MDKAININHTSTPALIGLIITAVAVLIARAYLTAIHATKVAYRWLKNKHNFADEEEPVTMTGYQYICFAVVALFVSVILSIDF